MNQYLIPWDKADIGPRVGFAYNIRPKTVIRGAYGIFYGGEEQQGGNPNRGESAPFNESPQLGYPAGVGAFEPNPNFANGAATGGLTVGFPQTVFTTFPVTSLQFREVASNFRNPMVQKWNIGVQQELTQSMVLEVGYQGNHSSHQLLQPDFNQCPNYYLPSSTINCNGLRPVPYIGSISGTATFGFGNYDALTAKLEKRLSNGLQMLISYTYGHALANSGTTLSGSNGFGNLNPLNYADSYSSAAWDIRHNFTAAITYDLPFGKGQKYGSSLPSVAQVLLGNWELNTIMTFHTGQPYTITSSGCVGAVVSECTPTVLGNPNAAPSGGRTPTEWFNTANFAAPAFGTYGSGMLQDSNSPPTKNVDFSVFKNFNLTERFKLQFRFEDFNLSNTPQFSTPGNNLRSSNFGQITSTVTGSERHIQFSLRLMF